MIICISKRTSGFTLVEFTVVVTVMAVLLSLAVPAFSQLSRNAALTTAANQLLQALHFGRAAALSRGVPVSVCLSNDGLRCLTRAGEPARGWLVLVDSQSDTAVLRKAEIVEELTLQGSRSTVSYWPAALAGTTATFTFCARAFAVGRAVVVSQSGRPRLEPRAVC
jgi:type IV fimbrial biogenesis protein FimT